MKILPVLVLLALAFSGPAFADDPVQLHPANWHAASNNTAVGNSETDGNRVHSTGNRVWTKEEMKERQANQGSSWFSGTTSVDSTGRTSIKQALNRHLGRQNADAIWSDLNQ